MRPLRLSPVFIGLIAIVIFSSFTDGHRANNGDEEEEEDGAEDDGDGLLLPFIGPNHDANEGIKIDEHIFDSIFDENFSLNEKAKEDEFERISSAKNKTKNVFDKVCPSGYFRCLNGECISPKWHCDGHYDCDDFSDELNCTTIDSPITIGETSIGGSQKPAKTQASSKPVVQAAGPTPKPNRIDDTAITFNSSIEPLMLFSTGTSIRGNWMRSRILFDVYGMSIQQAPKLEQSSITQALSVFFDFLNAQQAAAATTPRATDENPVARNTIVGLDMDPNNKEVFWVELGQDAGVYSTVISGDQFESRHRRQFYGPHRKTLVDSGLISPEDVALDTLGRNLYITDAGLPAIVVCSIKYSHCKTLVKDKLHKPRAIIADPSTGWLTYTDWGDQPGIYLVSMDGKRRETLIDTDVVWPNGLAADYVANHLYWADARLNKIERIDLATMKRRKIITESGSNPFSLALFENRIYWSDWAGNDIRTCEKSTGNNTKSIMRTDSIYGIHIYHPNLHRSHDEENPCWSKYCSHMCLLSPSTSFARRDTRPVNAVCSCPESMALSIGDRATCYEVQLSFLLINVRNYIGQVFPEQIGLHTVQKVIYSKEHVIHDVASDWLNFRLFFFDAAKEHIYAVDLSKKNAKIERFLEDQKDIRGLLYDSWSDNLYWLNAGAGSMSMCPVKAKYETVLRKDLDRPVSLVLDSKNRVFYISTLGAVPHIMRTDIFAQESSDLIIVGSDIGLPVALHLDEPQQRLYWADARHGLIESLDLDIKSRSGIKPHSRIQHKSGLGTILAFAIYHDQLLWMTQKDDYLYKSKIDDLPKDNKQVGFKLPPNPSIHGLSSDNKRIIVVDPRHEIIITPCRNAGCSHGCVFTANRTAVCVCPDGYKLSNRTACKLPERVPETTTAAPHQAPVPAASVDATIHQSNITAPKVEHLELPPHIEPPAHILDDHHDQDVIPKHSEAAHLELPHIDATHLEPPPFISDTHLAPHPQDLFPPHKEALNANEAIAEKNTQSVKLDDVEQAVVEEGSLTWLIVLLLVMVVAGLVTLAGIIFVFKPRRVSHLLVGFRSYHDKEGAVVLLDD